MRSPVACTAPAALKSSAREMLPCGSSRNCFFASSLLKQYRLPSFAVQVIEQLVARECPPGSPITHWPPNSGCAAPASGAAAPAGTAPATRIQMASALAAEVRVERERAARPDGGRVERSAVGHDGRNL